MLRLRSEAFILDFIETNKISHLTAHEKECINHYESSFKILGSVCSHVIHIEKWVAERATQ